jgi:hypothetical protein
LILATTLCGLALLTASETVSGQITPGSNVRAQTGPQFGIGYVGNAPEAIVGGSAYVILPRFGGIGLYVDAKFDLTNPEDERPFDGSVTAEEVENDAQYAGSQFISDEFSFRSFNVALVRPLSPALIIYAGGGVAQATNYRLYSVPSQGEIDNALWVRDPRSDEDRLNLMVGAMLRLSSVLSSQFGFETEPQGVTVGVSLRLPSW